MSSLCDCASKRCMGGLWVEEWSQVSTAFLYLVFESSQEKNKLRFTKICALLIYVRIDCTRLYRKMSVVFTCGTNTDAHTQLWRGPGLHFTAVCPTSSCSASFDFQLRDGKKMDSTETQRKRPIKLLFFSLASD